MTGIQRQWGTTGEVDSAIQCGISESRLLLCELGHDQTTLLGCSGLTTSATHFCSAVFPPFPLRSLAMLRGSKRTSGASTTSVRSLEMQPPVTSMFSATSLDFRLVDGEQKIGKLANPDHYAVMYIDEKPVPKAGYQTSMPAPRWPSFRFNISSVMKIAVYRKRRLHKDALVAQYKGLGRDFLDRDTKYELTDKRGSQIGLRLTINVDLISISPAEFIKSVTDNASLLKSGGSSETAQALGGLGLQVFQILKQIVPVMDEIANVSASCTENDLDNSIIRLQGGQKPDRSRRSYLRSR
ncbi:hypothetical protein FIBSPDRAFT_239768 [Athelia psychrophila]|uniref:Uncharacterized protein n=1 Tax=Athelia psychrophila TaxID=1759441 RepID=A0A165YD25_9AGAM|nr:hypothetical protein FIBSPDRAFT_239768 [Fibularhizoctonia sp. CBS 109695]